MRAKKLKGLSNEELVAKIKSGENEGFQELWPQVCGFIWMIARRFYRRYQDRCVRTGVSEDDLAQEGFFALIRAVDGFDASKDCKFLSYFGFALIRQFQDAIQMRTSRTRNDPSFKTVSLETQISDDENLSLQDSIPDPEAEKPFENVIETDYNRACKAAIDKALSELEPKRAQLVRQHYYDNLSIVELTALRNETHTQIRNGLCYILRDLRKQKALQYCYETIIDQFSYKGSGFRSWKEYGSLPERAVLRLEERGLL